MKCAVLTCPNRENTVDESNKISFHRFPLKKEYKSVWIKATGREASWKPTKSDSLCSEHFKPNLFHIRNKKPFVYGWALPTLNCVVERDDNITNNSTPISAPREVLTKSTTYETQDDEQIELSDDDDDDDMEVDVLVEQSIDNTPTTTNSSHDEQLAEIMLKISTQNRQIKHLLQRKRRYDARLPNLRDQIVNLNKSNETVCTILENLGFPIPSEVLSRIILCDRNEVNDAENPYSEAFEKFIVTLYSISPAAYKLMQTAFPEGVFPDEAFVKNYCSILEADFDET